MIIGCNMDRLVMIYNSAAHYREGIFTALDRRYDCEWWFGSVTGGIKEMDVSLLKKVHRYKTIGNPARAYWQCSIIRLLFRSENRNFFMLADIRSLSFWIFCVLAFTLFRRKKFYFWTHGWYGREKGFTRRMKLWLFRHADGTFLYGNYAKRLMVEQGIDADKLFVLHNSLCYDRQLKVRQGLQKTNVYSAHFGNNAPTLLFIGRLTAVKRLDMLIEAVARLKAAGTNCNLVFVGDGTERENLRASVEHHGLSQCVWFYGACYDEARNAELIYNADLCVSPGNVGLTAIHSMVFGTPVLTHDDFTMQMPEFEAVKPGVTGNFFKYGSISSLTEKIAQWLASNGTRREKVRNNCYAEIDNFWTPAFQMDVIVKNLKLA